MYILDHKINKSLTKIRDVLSDYFIDWLETYEEIKIDNNYHVIPRVKRIKLTPHKKELATDVVGCFVLNVAYRLKFGKTDIAIPRRESIYSIPLIYNGNNVNRSVSYTYTMLLCRFLVTECNCGEEIGYVKLKVDKIDYAKQKPVDGKKKAKLIVSEKKVSNYILSEEIIALFEDAKFLPEEVPMSVIEVRDETGKVISKKMTPKQRHMIKVLTLLNVKYKTNNLSIDGERIDFQLKKIYNNSSLNLGGRNYMTGTDATKAMYKQNRLKITINGEPCVELDYKSFFPSMMADMLGITFPEGFDPYAIQIDGCDKELLRDLAKKACLMLLNTDNMKAAQFALAAALSEEEWVERINEAKDRGEWPEGRIVHEIIEKLIERNGYLMHECQSSNALKYMNYESEINDIVLERVLMDGYIVIPLHDSFIVPVSAEKSTRNHMERAYELVIGGNNCRISSKIAEA